MKASPRAHACPGSGSASRWPRSALAALFASTRRRDILALGFLVILSALTWLPRAQGPIDLRWDGAGYYVLGTSLAEGRGYRLLSEPGEIQTVLHPPLLPIVVAMHQMALGTSDWRIVGRWLRFSFFVCFVAYTVAIYIVLRHYLPAAYAVMVVSLGLLHWGAQFLSDLLFAELPFALAVALFFIGSQRQPRRAHDVWPGLAAWAAYALRTAGLALFAAWVAEALLDRHAKKAVCRLAIALVPMLACQGYILAVQSGTAYRNPAYPYQRAAYTFPNVSYATNMFTFKDPFAPEKGRLSIGELGWRAVANVSLIPTLMGGAVSSMSIVALPGYRRIRSVVPIALTTLGVLALAGAVIQLCRRQWLVPVYVGTCIGLMCLTPFPGQFWRYLVPIISFIGLWLVLSLRALGALLNRRVGWMRADALPASILGLLLLLQITLLIKVDWSHRLPSTYVGAEGEQVEYRLYFNRPSYQAAEVALEWVRTHADPQAIVAVADPHWAYLRTGRKTVLPPFEHDVDLAQHLLDAVPVKYLVLQGGSAIDIDRYAVPVIERHPSHWHRVFVSPSGDVSVYERTGEALARPARRGSAADVAR